MLAKLKLAEPEAAATHVPFIELLAMDYERMAGYARERAALVRFKVSTYVGTQYADTPSAGDCDRLAQHEYNEKEWVAEAARLRAGR